jgi:hypothetical protein
MRTSGLLEDSIFKGGTSLRRFTFGLQGRFSLDLDFATMDRGMGELVTDSLEPGFTHEGATFVGFDIDKPALIRIVDSRSAGARCDRPSVSAGLFHAPTDAATSLPSSCTIDELGAMTGKKISMGRMLNQLAVTFGANALC